MQTLELIDTQNVTDVNKVHFIDLTRQYFLLRDEILSVVDQTLSSGQYILGETVDAFEKKLADYLNCKFVLAVANGTDAIILSLKALKIGEGDEVILPVNSFIATAGAVCTVGAKPILCDVKEDLNINPEAIESLITAKTKAIIAVHLTGRPADMKTIMMLARKHSLAVIEDAAQSIGATYETHMTGAIGDVGCFSLHPLKNLHVYGDGGFISTNNESLYQTMKLLRNHGLMNRDTCAQWGLNSRLDAVQAAIGTIGLKYLDTWNANRRKTAQFYQENLFSAVAVPRDNPEEFSVYHNFVIQTVHRDALMAFLLTKGIETKIHYPLPIHLQPAASQLGHQKGDFPIAEKLSQTMLSLPIYSELKENEKICVVENILNFYQNYVS